MRYKYHTIVFRYGSYQIRNIHDKVVDIADTLTEARRVIDKRLISPVGMVNGQALPHKGPGVRKGRVPLDLGNGVTEWVRPVHWVLK